VIFCPSAASVFTLVGSRGCRYAPPPRRRREGRAAAAFRRWPERHAFHGTSVPPPHANISFTAEYDEAPLPPPATCPPQSRTGYRQACRPAAPCRLSRRVETAKRMKREQKAQPAAEAHVATAMPEARFARQHQPGATHHVSKDTCRHALRNAKVCATPALPRQMVLPCRQADAAVAEGAAR